MNIEIIPETTPLIIKHCSKCNKKAEFYCSEKFRLNGNSVRLDIWLIYKCVKCDTTWKLTIKKGIRPHDLPKELFDKFTNNDSALAWQYAFDRSFLSQYEVKYSEIKYRIEGGERVRAENPTSVHISCPYVFDLKLSAVLSEILNISVSRLKKLADENLIRTIPERDIAKHKIRSDIQVIFSSPSAAAEKRAAQYANAVKPRKDR